MTTPAAAVTFLRHNGWVGPEDLNKVLTIVGCGAVGSNVALLAAKMGFQKFSLWDADSVENHNLPNQAYCVKHIGMKKVEALKQVLQEFNPQVEIDTHDCFFTKESSEGIEFNGPLVLATDTMSSREEIFDIFEYNMFIDTVFEARLGFDYGEVAVIDNLDDDAMSSWKASLRPDSEVPEGPCNLRICTTLVTLVSAYLVHQICAKYAAPRHDEEWTFKKRTVFQMNPLLTTHAF